MIREYKKIAVLIMSMLVLLGVNLSYAKESRDNILFVDDFSDANYTKENWKIQGNWNVNDKGEMEVNNIGTGSVVSSINDSDWKDYIFEVKIKILALSETRKNESTTGVHIRTSDEIDYGKKCKDVFVILSEKSLVTGLPGGAAEGKLYKKMEFKQGEWYQFKFVCIDKEIEVYMNDESLGVIKNDVIPTKGGIALWACFCNVVFDDVKISRVK